MSAKKDNILLGPDGQAKFPGHVKGHISVDPREGGACEHHRPFTAPFETTDVNALRREIRELRRERDEIILYYVQKIEQLNDIARQDAVLDIADKMSGAKDSLDEAKAAARGAKQSSDDVKAKMDDVARKTDIPNDYARQGEYAKTLDDIKVDIPKDLARKGDLKGLATDYLVGLVNDNINEVKENSEILVKSSKSILSEIGHDNYEEGSMSLYETVNNVRDKIIDIEKDYARHGEYDAKLSALSTQCAEIQAAIGYAENEINNL